MDIEQRLSDAHTHRPDLDSDGALIRVRAVHRRRRRAQLGAGVVAAAGFIYFGLAALMRATLSKAVGAAAVGAFVAIIVSIMVEGSLWQVWRLAAMALAASGVALAHILEKR